MAEQPTADAPDPPQSPEAVAAANVRRLREQAGLSQAELVERVNKTGHDFGEMAMWTLEGGKRRVRVNDLFALAEALGVTTAQLLDPDAEHATELLRYTVVLGGGVTQEVTADRVQEDEAGWLHFYRESERVLFAPVAQILCVRPERELR